MSAYEKPRGRYARCCRYNGSTGYRLSNVGSGSGLFSLAAAALGASPIHSFDYDPESVECTRELKRQFRPEMGSWTIKRGDVLDAGYIDGLGQFDVVYCWGVLFATGDLWTALELVTRLVKPGGRLFLAIYNDQGFISRCWAAVKRTYNVGWPGRLIVTAVFVPYFAGRGLLRDLIGLRNPATRYRQYKRQRGMSMVNDWRDWLGGYPFEVASRESVTRFCEQRRLHLTKLKSAGRTLGNNEFIFVRPT